MADARPPQPHATVPPPAPGNPPLGGGFEEFASARHSLDPEYIGHYRILQRIGEGGMGVVYVAEQREPVRRTVALKVIKLGMDSKEVVARFEAERQALALMSHPNVAKVFEAGMTETGRPFFAMEHVPGVPLTQYCDENKLSTRQRLELFITVCHAVQHAHQKGIIHRDLKPSNVLVTLFDGKPVPKVIDFGIAKAANQHLTQHTLFTQTGSLIGTPEYMSPEQAQTSGLDVDTRTDIYALGVILYELLTGTTPFDTKALRGGGPDQMARIIRETEPPRPSTRLTSIDSTPDDVAKRHGTDVRSLHREVRGDLDWIALKAMEKDRTRRYDTANGLAADVQRHLDNEPVLARPPSTVYRWSKFARKHRAGMAAAAMVALALLIGLGGTTYGFLRARAERDHALSAEAQALQAQAAEAREREAAEAVNNFLQEMLASADPNVAQGKEVTVRQALDEASKKVEQGSLKDQPAIEASVRQTLGRTYWVLLQWQTAEKHLRTSLEIRSRVHGAEHPSVAESLDDLGRLLRDQRNPAAEDLLARGLAMRRKLWGNDHPDVAMSLMSLGYLHSLNHDEVTAEPMYREALAIRRKHLGDDHAYVASTLMHLSRSLSAKNDSAGAEVMLREALATQRKRLGDEHLHVATALTTLAATLRGQGKSSEAEAALREALAIRERLLGQDDPPGTLLMQDLGELLLEKGDADGAERLYRQVCDIRSKWFDDYSVWHTQGLEKLADHLREKGNPSEAEALLRENLHKCQARAGKVGPATSWTMAVLARHLQLTGRAAEAEPLAREAVEMRRKDPPADRAFLHRFVATLTPVALDLSKHSEAEALARESLSLLQPLKRPFEPWMVGEAKILMGTALLAQNRAKEGEPLLEEGYQEMSSIAVAFRFHKRDALQRLVRMYQATAEPQKAARWQARLDAIVSSPATQPAAAG